MGSAGHLRALCAGSSDRRVILFPGVLGNLTGYSNVVTALKASCELYGLRYASNIRNGDRNALQALAEQCAEHILELPDARPTHLLGWSLGGLMARECGAVLSSRGRAPVTIVMVDPARRSTAEQTPSPGEPMLGRAERQELLWRRFLNLKCDAEGVRRVLAHHDFFALSESERFKLVQVHQKRWSTEVLPPVGLRTSFRLMCTTHDALKSYVPSPCPGALYAICSDRYWTSESPHWHEDASDSTCVIRVRGDHLTAILHFAIPAIVEIVSGAAIH